MFNISRGHAGATYTSDYWRFGYKPEVYSYERAALRAGYSVLSFDLLGCGDSEFPDPFLVVQIPLNIQLAIATLKAVRNGSLAPRRVQMPKFSKIAYVGHSMGSGVLNGVIAEAPHLVDATVLTGVRRNLRVSNGAHLDASTGTHPSPSLYRPSPQVQSRSPTRRFLIGLATSATDTASSPAGRRSSMARQGHTKRESWRTILPHRTSSALAIL